MRLLVFCKCGKVKRFGEWIEPPVELKMKIFFDEFNMHYTECDRCKGAKP